MNNGFSRFIGAFSVDSPTSARCSWTRYQFLCPQETGAGFACGTVLPSSVKFACANGYTASAALVCVPNANRVVERPCECDEQINSGNLPAPVRGDPVVLKTGAVVESAIDYASDDGRFVVSRRYSSKATGGAAYIQAHITSLGGRWSYDFSPELQLAPATGTPTSPSSRISFMSADGSVYEFALQSSGTWLQSSSGGVADLDTRLKLQFLGVLPANLASLHNSSTQWQVTDASDTIWIFKTVPRPNSTYYSYARPISRVARDGYRWDYVYNTDGSLASITDSYGRLATFEWRKMQVTTQVSPPANALPIPMGISKITLPDQTSLRFSYDPPASTPVSGIQPRNLIKVERLDVASVVIDSTTYLYEDARYPAFITGIVNHRGERTASFAFGALAGQAIMAEGPGGADRHTFSYVWTATTMTTTVTGPLGKVDVYTFTKTGTGYDFRLTSVNGNASPNTQATSTTLANNSAAATLTSVTDPLLRQTTYLYDSTRRPTSVTEAAGLASARTTTVAYDPVLNLPATITRPGLAEVRTFNAGKLTALTLTDTTSFTVPYATNGRTRTWGYSWSPTGQLLGVDGPLPGSADSVTMTYDAAGQLLTQTNPVGHVTQVISRNAQGKPLIVRDPNGVDTVMTYDALGRPLTITRDPGASQSHYALQYDAAGNLTRITLPTGGWLEYTYDGANRLTRIENDSGEYQTFTLNAAGSATAENTYAPGGAIQRQNSHVYDELGRLIRTVGAGGETWQFAYDKLGNPVSSVDARGKTSLSSVDAFDRPITATNPENQTQNFAYTPFEANLTQFKDGRGLATNMVVDGFGETIQESSPDRGLTRYWYDQAGRVTQALDADGVTTAYAYDPADRLLSETASGSGFATQTIAYSYDSTTGGNRGIGRLTSVNDPTGSETLVYDAQGRVIQRTKVIGTRSYTFGYAYDASGQVTAITYPSGHVVDYIRAPDGRVTAVQARTTAGGAQTALANAITYKPFGPLSSLMQGNGLSLTRSYDGNYWLSGVSLTGTPGTLLALTISRDANGRVIGVADSAAPLRNATYSYTDAGRLASATGIWGTDSYTWDANDNRVRADRTLGGSTASDVATLAPGTNRLAELRDGAGVLSRSFSHTPGGDTSAVNRVGAPALGFSYDARGRLSGVASGGTTIAAYAYDWRGQRVMASSVEVGSRHYLYDEDGRLLAEHDGTTGALVREYVWLDTMPLALVSGPAATPAYTWITSGNLGEPLLLTNASGALSSSVTRDPWGNPVLLAGGVPLELGYPGQWKDPATGLFQNHHRDYDPTTGRYVQADPLGLGGGSNVFAYVGGDPLNMVDPDGLRPGPAMLFPFITAALVSINGQLLANGCIDWNTVAIDTGIGGFTGGFGGSVARSSLARMSIQTKGRIGEAIAAAGIRARGGKILARGQPAKSLDKITSPLSRSGGRSKPDFLVRRISGKIEVVEAKFGTARLSAPQRALQDDLGSAFSVARTSAEDVIGLVRATSASFSTVLSSLTHD